MNTKHSYHDRRSNSQLLPRVYLTLQVLIAMLANYIAYTVLNAIDIQVGFIYAAMFLVNIYILNKILSKYKTITNRNSFTKEYDV